jgi:hypothetical protein
MGKSGFLFTTFPQIDVVDPAILFNHSAALMRICLTGDLANSDSLSHLASQIKKGTLQGKYGEIKNFGPSDIGGVERVFLERGRPKSATANA